MKVNTIAPFSLIHSSRFSAEMSSSGDTGLLGEKPCLLITSTILARFSSERSAIISMSIVILAYPKRFTAIPPTTRYLTPTDSNSLNISSYIIIVYYLWQDRGVNGVPGIIYSMRREYGIPSSPRTTTLGEDFFFFKRENMDYLHISKGGELFLNLLIVIL